MAKKSVNLIYQRGNTIKSRSMGEIAEDIKKIFIDTFGEYRGLSLCDDLGCVLIPLEEELLEAREKEEK